MDRRTVTWSISLDTGEVFGGTVMTQPVHLEKKFNPSQRLVSLQYDHQHKGKGTLRMNFYNEDLLYFESPRLMKGTEFEFSFGYPGVSSEVYSAIVTGVTGFREIQVEATLQENAFSYLPQTRTWENTSRSTIAKKIAEENGFTLMDIERVQERKTFNQNNQTDREFLLDLAEEVNFLVYTRMENGVLSLHFHKQEKDAQPFWKLTWRGGHGNMINFDITDNSILGVPGSVEVAGYDPDNREVLRAKAKKAQQASLAPFQEVLVSDAATGEVFNRYLKDKNAIQQVKSVLPKPLVDMLDAQIQANTADEKATEEVIKARTTLVGEPRLEAGYVVELSGLPSMLAGNWWVEGIKQSLTSSGYTTELNLTRDSMGTLPTAPEEWNASAGFPNKKQAQQKEELKAVETFDGITGEIYKAFVK